MRVCIWAATLLALAAAPRPVDADEVGGRDLRRPTALPLTAPRVPLPAGQSLLPDRRIAPPPPAASIRALPPVTRREAPPATIEGPARAHRPSPPRRTVGLVRRLPKVEDDPPVADRTPAARPLPSRGRPIALYEAIVRSVTSNPLVRELDGDVRIRSATAFDPQIAAATSRAADARFDPRVSSSVRSSVIDQPPDAFFGPGLAIGSRRNEIDAAMRLKKLWATGTTSSVGYEPPLAYLFFPRGVSSGFNPLHSSDLVLELRQPLLQGGGRRANLAPLRIAQARVDRSTWEFNAALQAQLRSVEEAYWRLHAALVALRAVERVIPLAARIVEIERSRFEEERVTYADVARAAVTLENFEQQRAAARLAVQRSELNLRQLTGVPLGLGPALVPVDSPRMAPPAIPLDRVIEHAIARRPDLLAQRTRLEALQQQVVLARNNRLPRLDAQVQMRTSGLAPGLDDALEQMSEFDFNSWTFGLSFDSPVGNRRGRSLLRAAELQLAKEGALFQGRKQQVAFELAGLRADAQAEYVRFESAVRQVEGAEKWLELSRIRFEKPPVRQNSRDSLLLALFDYQQAMQSHIDAVTSAADRLASYNIVLARIDEAAGALLARWRIDAVP